MMHELRYQFAKLQWSTQRRADFYQLLSNFTADGLPLYEALAEIHHQYHRFNNPVAALTGKLLPRMRGAGNKVHTLGSALDGLVPVIEAMAIRSGEDAGDISAGLQRATDIALVQDRISRSIRNELAYPLFLFVLLGLLMIALSSHIVPTMHEIMPQHLWPGSAQRMAMVAEYTPVIMITGGLLVIASLWAYLRTRSRWTGQWRHYADSWLFPYTLHRRTSGALLLSSLSALLKIGVPFSLALQRLADSSGAWERAHINRVRGRLRRGEREGKALAGNLFEAEVRWQLELYGRLNRFAEALDQLSERALHQTERRIKQSFSILRTCLLFVVAGLIFWIYSAFMAITLAARSLG